MRYVATKIDRNGSEASKTTALMTGAQGVEALKKAANVAKGYRPAH